MSHPRSPARWLGPLALAVALAAVLAIVTASTGTEESKNSRATSTTEESGGSQRREQEAGDREQTSTDAAQGETETKPKRKTYTVKAGDTLAGIAEETGVPIEEIERLNPKIDASSLSIGQEIRLAR